MYISPRLAVFAVAAAALSVLVSSGAVAVNKNDSTQSNNLGQSADQQQRGGSDDCGCRDECNPCGECKPCDEWEGRCED